MIKKGVLLACVWILALGGAYAQSAPVSPEGPSRVLDSLAESYYQPTLRAAFGSFTFEYTNLPTPFSRWLEDQLASAASKSYRVKLLNRSAAAALDPAFKEVYGEFLETTGTEALLHGQYFEEGAFVRVHLELTELSTGTLIGAGDWRLALSRVPSYAAVEPASDARARARELASLGFTAPQGLTVSVSTDRGPGAAYRDGESMEVLVAVNKTAYIRLYHVDGAGRIQLIWPNRFGGGDGLVEAGSTLRLPGSQPFQFLLHAPFGTEFIKAVASTSPYDGREADFSDLGTSARGVMKRGLSVLGSARPEAAEALASYYIGPAR